MNEALVFCLFVLALLILFTAGGVFIWIGINQNEQDEIDEQEFRSNWCLLGLLCLVISALVALFFAGYSPVWLPIFTGA